MQKSATVALISNNKLLLLRRGNSAPWMPGKYCLPGGRLDLNETLENCAARELFEETGILIKPDELTPHVVKYKNGYKKTIFVCNKNCDYLVNLSWEHDDYKWVSYAEAHDVDIVPTLMASIRSMVSYGYLV